MIDFVTVVYNDELNFLETQARSIELYVPREQIGKIIVILNEELNKPLPEDNIPCVVDPAWYGINADKVQIFDYHDFGYTNYNYDYSFRAGWENQQLCKLLAAKLVQNEWYCVLDAKTWFVNPFNYFNFVSGDAHKFNIREIEWHPGFAESVKSINRELGIDMKTAIGPAGVPFFVHSNTVLEMMQYIENVVHPGEKFHDFFLTRSKVEHPGFITEFCLYSGYILKKYGHFNELYHVDPTNCSRNITPVNIDTQDLHRFNELFVLMQHPIVTTVSIHRNAVAKLKLHQLKLWLNFLEQRNLILPR